MSKRNSQNPIRKETRIKKERNTFVGGAAQQPGKTPGTMECPSCGADVPPKPGFRMQSLKCPKCGASMHKGKINLRKDAEKEELHRRDAEDTEDNNQGKKKKASHRKDAKSAKKEEK